MKVIGVSDLDEMSDAESEFSTHDSNTEQSEGNSVDTDDEDDTDDNNNSPLEEKVKNKKFLLGKDKTTKWFHDPPNQKVRTKQQNIVIRLPGVKNCAKDTKTPLGCWNLFFLHETFEKIVDNINIFLEGVRLSKKPKTEIQPTSIDEIRAMIGLLYLIEVHKASKLNLKELWATDSSAPECFRVMIKKTRFYNLLSALKFDRDDRKKLDNLAPIQEFSENFIKRFQEKYTPGPFLTIGETLQAFRGRRKFWQYIVNKPARYGIKIYSMTDSKTFYTYNIEIYCGKQPSELFQKSKSVFDVVKRLTTPILKTGRNVTCDNYYTSVPLVNYLLENNTTLVGTIRRNKQETPKEMTKIKNRSIYSSKFVFTNKSTLVSYVPKKFKNILMYSTLHDSTKIDEDTGEKLKLEIVTFYNQTKAGADVVDQLQGEYDVARDTGRWLMVIFYVFLIIAGINSKIIYEENTGKKVPR